MPDASERRTLAACAFVASLLLFPLGGRLNSVQQLFRDRIAALSALTLAAILFLFHVVMTRREAAAAPNPPAPEPPPPEDAPASLPTDGGDDSSARPAADG